MEGPQNRIGEMQQLPNVLRTFAQAGFDRLLCPIPGCSAYDELPLQGWLNHLYRAHLNPAPERRCPYTPCTVTGRDPGMRVHIKAHGGS